MRHDPRQPTSPAADVEHRVSNERARARGQAGSLDFRPGRGTGAMYELRTTLYWLVAEVTNRVDPASDSLSPLDDLH